MSTLRLRDKLRGILTVKDTPHRVAMSFAVGVFIGMSPLLGVHTVLGLVAAWLFRLNRLVALTGVYVTNPWSIVPIYTFCTWVGALILGKDTIIPEIDWGNISLGKLLNDLSPVLLPFVVGTTLVGLLSGGLGYILIRKAVERTQRGR